MHNFYKCLREWVLNYSIQDCCKKKQVKLSLLGKFFHCLCIMFISYPDGDVTLRTDKVNMALNIRSCTENNIQTHQTHKYTNLGKIMLSSFLAVDSAFTYQNLGNKYETIYQHHNPSILMKTLTERTHKQ